MADDIWIIENAGYTIERINNKPQAVVILFSRNYNNKFETITHKCYNFRPYFYVPYNETSIELPFGCDYDDELIIDALGREVRKVYTDIPSTVAKIRDQWSFTDMSDFLFEKRFLVDYKIKYAYTFDEETNRPSLVEIDGILEPRVVYYDIEVVSPLGTFPDPIEAKYPVISIQVMDSYTEKILVFTNSIPQTTDSTHIACKKEADLFNIFLKYLDEINPDLVTAWSSDGFDLPYLIRRSWKIGVDFNKFANYGKVSAEYQPDGSFRLRVPGLSTLDMLKCFKKFTTGMAQRESYALKSVIADSEILKDYAFEYADLGPILEKVLNENRYDDFIQYCKNDVIALNHINKATNIFNFYESIRFISGCKLDDVLFNSKIIEMLILHEGIKPMPLKQHIINEDDTFEGATVITPKPGISEYMGSFDLSSLYPTILIAFQTSPDIDKIFLKTLEKTMEMREDLRAKCKADPDNIMLENQQLAIKFINNSYYGYLGLKSGRLYKKEIAEFVTSTGRELNQFLQDIASSNGYNVIFGDTDSIGVIFVKDVQTGKNLEYILNDKLKQWSQERKCKINFFLKFEKLYRRILFKSDKDGIGVKKKYCGHLIWEEGRVCDELNYKGLELKRSDQSDITRECLRFFLEQLLIEGNETLALDFVKEKYNQVKSGNVNILDISIPKAVRKVKYNTDNAWIRGINTAKDEYNYIIQEGVKPRLIYLKHGEICIDEDFDVNLIKDLIDYNIMAEKTIKKKMESYIWSIGYDWNSLVLGQKSLDQWF